MGRNLYILAATLALFALISCGLAYTNVAQQPGSPGDVSLWRTTGLGLLVVAILVAILGMLSALFEQAEHRAEEARLREREQRRTGNAPPRPVPRQEPVRVSLKELSERARQLKRENATSGNPPTSTQNPTGGNAPGEPPR